MRVSNEGYTEGTLTLIVDPPDTATKIVRISSDSSISSEFSAKTESDQDEINKKQNSEVSEASDDNVTALLSKIVCYILFKVTLHNMILEIICSYAHFGR